MSIKKKILGVVLICINLFAVVIVYFLPYQPSKLMTLPVDSQKMPPHIALFFGYTTCPSICPNTLGVLKQVQDSIGREDVQMVFVNLIEPHEAGATADEYAKSFHKAFVGWQLGPIERKRLVDECNVFFTAETKRKPLQHSPNIYLLNKEEERWRLEAVYHRYPANLADLVNLFNTTFIEK